MTSIRIGSLLMLFALAPGCAGMPSTRDPAHEPALPDRLVYRRYETPLRGSDGKWSGRGLPLALALDEAGNPWVLGEFHTHLQSVSASAPVSPSARIEIPHHPDALPFTGLHGVSTRNSILGESVVIDRRGRVWLSQGGGHLVQEGVNHSRVVSYEPSTNTFRAYNLPGNRNEAMGLLWDEGRGLVWVAESGMRAIRRGDPEDVDDESLQPGALLAFDPDEAPHDNDFRWKTSLDQLLCPAPTPRPAGCFARYELPAGALAPAHLVSDASGALWFTLFWGAAIGRLDPETGDVTLYPLAPGIGVGWRAQAVGAGPWEIAISPDGAHVVWSEFFDSTIARLPLARALDPACRALREGRNPCIEETRVPGADQARQQVHSIAFDRFGNLWFTQSSTPGSRGVRNSIGFVTADWSRVVLLERLGDQPLSAASYTGIAIDPESGDIWVAEFLPPGVGRLTPVDPDRDPATW